MKKSMILGAAALAAMAFAPGMADAGGPVVGKWKKKGDNVSMGGYYFFRVQDTDNTLADDASIRDEQRWWAHRLELQMDFTVSNKTHAHMVTRVVDSGMVEGAHGHSNNNNVGGSQATDGGDWDIRQLWLETEAWGFGVKVGDMPLSLNDKILVNHDTTSFGTIMLSRTFGDITAVLANVRWDEGNASGLSENDTTRGADDDDIDLYFLTLLGEMNDINLQFTAAYMDAQEGSNLLATLADTGVANGSDTNNHWLALTANTMISGIDLTGTVIWEGGWDNATSAGQAEESDFLAALRAKGKTGFGGWNAYAFYAGEDFDNIVDSKQGWSATWDNGGPGGVDLMGAHGFTDLTENTTGDNAIANLSNSENMTGIGAGLTFNAGGWTINPMLDYASVVEEDLNDNGISDFAADSAWGGTLKVSTKLDTNTTLYLQGTYVDPDETADNANVDDMYLLEAAVKMAF
ncbi:MAG: hypothetical protein HQL52_15555 [Magnetococcales bacterium]|nr:hypothetical protein [Magnetococcales bacterium]